MLLASHGLRPSKVNGRVYNTTVKAPNSLLQLDATTGAAPVQFHRPYGVTRPYPHHEVLLGLFFTFFWQLFSLLPGFCACTKSTRYFHQFAIFVSRFWIDLNVVHHVHSDKVYTLYTVFNHTVYALFSATHGRHRLILYSLIDLE